MDFGRFNIWQDEDNPDLWHLEFAPAGDGEVQAWEGTHAEMLAKLGDEVEARAKGNQ